jgi:hypothetical protein
MGMLPGKPTRVLRFFIIKSRKTRVGFFYYHNNLGEIYNEKYLGSVEDR